MNLQNIQAALRDSGQECWLFYDHHHRDPIAYRVLGLSPTMMVTRRWFYLVPAQGEPVKLVHRIESHHLDSLPGSKMEYSAWQELWQNLEAMLKPYKRIVMQYSPNNQIPYISLVDAGMLELIRSFGKEIVSSANLVAHFEATLTRRADGLPLQGARCHRQDCHRVLPGNREARAQWRHARVRDAAVDHGGLRPRGPGDRRSAERQRERPQRRSALRAQRGDISADQRRRLRAARHLGKDDAAGLRVLRHHVDRRRSARPATSSARFSTSCAARATWASTP